MVIDLQIAGITFRIESDISIRGLKSSKLKRFQINSTKPDVYHLYKVIPNNSITLPPLDKNEKLLINHCSCYLQNHLLKSSLFNSYIVRNQLNICLKQIDSITIEIQPNSIVIFNHKSCEIFIFYSQDFGKSLVNFILGPSIFAQFLPIFSAAMIHSSAVVIDKKAAIFLAPDEGGKTTAAKLAPDYPILCDDQNVIRKQENKFFAYATPWGSFKNNPLKAPVGAFFLLEKGGNFKLTQIEPKDILSYLWSEHLPYYFYLPKNFKHHYFNFIYDLSFKIPGYLLTFPKDYIDWDAVDRAMKK